MNRSLLRVTKAARRGSPVSTCNALCSASSLSTARPKRRSTAFPPRKRLSCPWALSHASIRRRHVSMRRSRRVALSARLPPCVPSPPSSLMGSTSCLAPCSMAVMRRPALPNSPSTRESLSALRMTAASSSRYVCHSSLFIGGVCACRCSHPSSASSPSASRVFSRSFNRRELWPLALPRSASSCPGKLPFSVCIQSPFAPGPTSTSALPASSSLTSQWSMAVCTLLPPGPTAQ